jgi:hypothetical protein
VAGVRGPLGKGAPVGFTKQSLERCFWGVRQEGFKDHPFGGCLAHRDVVALGATAPHRSVGKGVQEMHLLQIEHHISVEQVAQTDMEEHL